MKNYVFRFVVNNVKRW